MTDNEASWRLTASHWFALTVVMTAVDQSVEHSFIQWSMTSHFKQRSAAFCASISAFRIKFLSQCTDDNSEKVCVIVVITFSETER